MIRSNVAEIPHSAGGTPVQSKTPVQQSEERLQEHSAIGDERHDEAEYGAHDDGRDLPIFNVYPDEDEALDRQDRSGHHGQHRMPVESTGHNQSDHADEFRDAEDHPALPR